MSHTATSRRSFLKALGGTAVAAPLLAHAERVDAALTRSLASLDFDADDAAAVRRLREQYMLSPDLIYLNHASIGTIPRAVHEAHVAYLEICESNPSTYVWGRTWRDVTEDTRLRAAELLRCQPDDLAITHNTTEGFSTLAHGLPLGGGDEVLFSSLNHPGASVAWRGLAERRGFAVRSFDFPVTEGADLDAVDVVRLHIEAIRPETRVLVVPHVDNMIGIRHPLAELSEAARDQGVEFVLVDGAQSAGMIPVDLASSGVDAYSMSPHKWVQSPKGTGLFYVSERLRAVLPRMWYRTSSDFGGSARQYEDYSTRAWPAVVALGDALTFQNTLGEPEKQRRYRAIWRTVQDRVDEEERLAWRSPRDPQLSSMIVAIEVLGAQASALGGELMEREGISVRAFGGELNSLRISPNVMTPDEEIQHFLDVVSSAAP